MSEHIWLFKHISCQKICHLCVFIFDTLLFSYNGNIQLFSNMAVMALKWQDLMGC